MLRYMILFVLFVLAITPAVAVDTLTALNYAEEIDE